jgi:hypothetical protein
MDDKRNERVCALRVLHKAFTHAFAINVRNEREFLLSTHTLSTLLSLYYSTLARHRYIYIPFPTRSASLDGSFTVHTTLSATLPAKFIHPSQATPTP